MEEIKTQGTYLDYKKELDTELKKTAEGFVRIGYLLKIARDTEILKESPYDTVTEFAQAEYGLDKTQVSRFIRINDKFSESGYSERLKTEYQGFGYAKLSIMLTLPDNINEELTPDFSKSDIQAIKTEYEEEKKISDIEVMLEDREDTHLTLDTVLDKAVFYLGKSDTGVYKKLWELEKRDAAGDEIIKELAPAGKMMYSVRIPGEGRFAVVMDAAGTVRISNMRDENDKQEFLPEELKEIVERIIIKREDWVESWQTIYREELIEKQEVAPVQPKKQEHFKAAKSSQNTASAENGEKKPEDEQKSSQNEVEERTQDAILHDIEPEIPAPDPKPEEPKQEEQQQEEIETEIPGQDDIMNHPEYMPGKTDKELIDDMKMTSSTIDLTLKRWDGYIPHSVVKDLIARTERLKELLEEMQEKYAHADKN